MFNARTSYFNLCSLHHFFITACSFENLTSLASDKIINMNLDFVSDCVIALCDRYWRTQPQVGEEGPAPVLWTAKDLNEDMSEIEEIKHTKSIEG